MTVGEDAARELPCNRSSHHCESVGLKWHLDGISTSIGLIIWAYKAAIEEKFLPFDCDTVKLSPMLVLGVQRGFVAPRNVICLP